MALRNGTAVHFMPMGLTDAVDQSSSFPGACQILSNAVFDRQNRGALVSRTGAVSVTTFGGFTTPGIISVSQTVGARIYGMIATGRNAGNDEPFCYDTSIAAFVTISGITAGNTPTTPASTGAWIPPTMDVIGTKIIITHQGFSGSNFFGIIDISNPAAPAWSAGNTTVNALPVKPLWVSQFYGRAYYGVGNAVYFSDSLSATTISNANFAGVLTLGDTSNTIIGSGLAFSTSSAGILQSLVVFKANSIYQISGDISLTGSQALSLNLMSANVGCVMPRTAQSTPYGVIFIATDGPRLVDLRGQIQYLSQMDNEIPDVVAPFSNATTPSRACAAYTNGVYRVALDTAVPGFTTGDYWYDFLFQRWTGPHTFQYHGATPLGNSFYLISNTAPAAIFKSDVIPSGASIYLDNGNAYGTTIKTAAMPTVQEMAENAVTEMTIELGTNISSSVYNVIAYNALNAVLGQLTVMFGTTANLWGGFNWGAALWSAGVVANNPQTIKWPAPLVFKKLILYVNSAAAAGVSVREFGIRYQPLGYVNA